MVHGHAGVARPEGTLFDALREVDGGLAEVGINTVLHEFIVVAVDRLFKTGRVDAHLFSEFADRRGRPGLVDLDAFMNGLAVHFVVAHEVFVVADRVGIAFGRAEDGVADHVAASAFIHDAVAALVDVDGAVHVEVEKELHLLAGGSARGGLNEVHADQIPAHADGGHRDFAR